MRNCKKCRYLAKDRDAMLRFNGTVKYMCVKNKPVKYIKNPKWHGFMCCNFKEIGNDISRKEKVMNRVKTFFKKVKEAAVGVAEKIKDIKKTGKEKK